MEIYRKNIKAMESKSYLYKPLRDNTIEESQEDGLKSVELIDTKEGVQSILINYNDLEYRLNSSYYPVREAKKWAEQFAFDDMYNIIFMFGLGNGTFVREIMKRNKKDDIIIVYEPCLEVFNKVLKYIDMTDILNQDNIIIVVEGINDSEFTNILKSNIDWLNIHLQKFCVHPTYDLIFVKTYKKYLIEIKSNNEFVIINRNTMEYVGDFTVDNTIRNIKYFKKNYIDMDFYKGFPENIPAIIVSAGPSLNKNFQYLKDAKGKAVIIVVDRALKFLLKNGIEPDFVATLDAGKPSEYFTDDENLKIPLFCTMDASKAIMEKHSGKKIFYSIRGFASYLLKDLGKKLSTLNTGGSVATGAFSVCTGLGFKTIILIGQDLAYGSNKLTHAEGISADDLSEVTAKVEGVHGGMVEIRHDWNIYRKWFENSIETFPELNVVDATEGGAKINGSKIMKFSQAIDTYCVGEFDTNIVFKDKKPAIMESEYSKVYNLIEASVNDLDEIIRKTKEAVDHAKLLITASKKRKISSPHNQKIIGKITKTNQLIIDKPVYQLIDDDIATKSVENLAGIYKLTGDEQKDQIVTYQKAENIYLAINGSAKRIKPLLEDLLSFYKEADSEEI